MTVEIQKAHIETQIRKAGQMREAAEQRFEKRVDAIQSERSVTRQTAYAMATTDAEAQQAYNAIGEIQELEREQVAALHKLTG